MTTIKNTVKQPQAANAVWAAIIRLCDKVDYHLHTDFNITAARSYAIRLSQALVKADPNEESIIGESCRSLVSEAEGNIESAIRHRENELALIEKLRKHSKGKPYEKHILASYSDAQILNRQSVLVNLMAKRSSPVPRSRSCPCRERSRSQADRG